MFAHPRQEAHQSSDMSAKDQVPIFFDTLHRLHARYDTAKLLADADVCP